MCGHCLLVEGEAALTRLVAHSALRDLVGAEGAARWVRELEEVEEEYPFLEYAAKLVRGEERAEKPWAVVNWLTMEGFGWRVPEDHRGDEGDEGIDGRPSIP